MPWIHRRAGKSSAPALVVASLVTALVAGCSFSSAGPGLQVETKSVAGAGSPPSGVTDPALQPVLQTYYRQKLTWTGCESGMQCAQVRVPLNWSQPAGATIEMAVNRMKARGSSLGALVLNPGGPGVSGMDYAAAAARSFGPSVREHYDIVGFDPRGVGASSPVHCLSDAQLDVSLAADATPDNSAELAAAVADARQLGRACEAHTGPLLDHVDTISVVKDLDVLRAALGQSTLTYQGASYGTFIGAWYAELFPWRVGRMVLDGAIDPTLDSQQYLDGQAEGFSRVLRAYVTDCLANSDCPLRGTPDEALSQLGAMVQQSDTSPLSVAGGRKLTQSLLLTGISEALYSTQYWPTLTEALIKVMSGDGAAMMALADAYYRRGSNGHYLPDVTASNPAIFCLDNAETRTPEQIQADAEKVGREYPPLGGSISWGGITCSQWPLKAVVPHKRLTAQGAPPILVVGTLNDPATPYRWARSLASQLSSGRLLTWDGNVHTAYHQGSTCIDNAIETYLLNGDLPATGTRCE